MAQEQSPTKTSTNKEAVPESGRQQTGMARSGQNSPEAYRSYRNESPFTLIRRLSDEMDRMFDNFFTRGFGLMPSSRSELGMPEWSEQLSRGTWRPQIEVSHEGNKLVVQADLPGLKKEDVTVEVKDDVLTISGERSGKEERKEGGYYRSERTYGSFRRTVPLPQGAKADTASATFENGVLRVEVEAPSEGTQGRRVEVRGP